MTCLTLALESIGMKMASQLVSDVADCLVQVGMNKAGRKATW